MSLRPPKGALVGFCLRAGSHECDDPTTSRRCWLDYGIVGEYKNTWASTAVPIKTLTGSWTYIDANSVWPAMHTFTGPVRRAWNPWFP